MSTIWVTCESCFQGNGKRALLHYNEPWLNEDYRPNKGEHGKWESHSPVGWIESTDLPIELGECKKFELVLREDEEP